MKDRYRRVRKAKRDIKNFEATAITPNMNRRQRREIMMTTKGKELTAALADAQEHAYRITR